MEVNRKVEMDFVALMHTLYVASPVDEDKLVTGAKKLARDHSSGLDLQLTVRVFIVPVCSGEHRPPRPYMCGERCTQRTLCADLRAAVYRFGARH